MGTIPDNWDLDSRYKKKRILSDKYQAWTASDLIEILSDYPPDAPVWIVENDMIHPIEVASCSDGHAFIG